ncbi:hypothetical protein LCGC14_1273260 [marine sediment metagenome]|uniref:Uncharacterized protein n=1 Tax=marine sediment metagenome TaxID=412755 RepID=A0A0F9KZ93_9ZZZZ
MGGVLPIDAAHRDVDDLLEVLMSAARKQPTTSAIVLKWIAGITAGIIGALIVIVLVSTAEAVSSHGDRLTVVETRDEATAASVVRIERKVDQLIQRGSE